MFRTNLKFFARVFLKDKFFSLLNIFGLALGIAVAIILMLILQNDLNYDKYHEKHANIYRLGAHLEATGIDIQVARSARELGRILQEEIPEVQAFTRANSWDQTMVKVPATGGNEKSFYEENIVRADSTYFTLFTHEFISGNPANCLAKVNTAVLTKSIAEKYFDTSEALGKVLILDNQTYEVTGVIQDVPENTHLKFDMMISGLIEREWVVQKNGEVKSEGFWNPDVYTYLLFPDNYDTKNFEAKFKNIYDKYFKSFGDQVQGKYTPILEPLTDIHFHSKLDSDEPHGNIAYLYAFTGIGFFIILLASINYMNLSTAKSVNRASEIAMKKTMGSSKSSLVFSFLGESIFLAFISLAVSLVIVSIVLESTSFNQLINKNLSFNVFDNPWMLGGAILITISLGIISGLYPAFYLPSIPTIQALKGSFKNQRSSHTLRKALTTFQFAISIFVVICTILMQNQIDFVRNKDLGFDKENVLIIPIQDTLVERQITGIKSEFLKIPEITSATTSYNIPGMNTGGSAVMWAEAEGGMKQQAFNLMFVGEDYIKTMNMKLLSGSDFPEGNYDRNSKFIANEAAVKLMGWDKPFKDGSADPLGRKVKFFHQEKDGEVIGVVKNFNFNSLHNPVEPLLIIKAEHDGGFLHLKIQSQNLPGTIANIQTQFQKFDPNHPFEFFFLDQKFNEQYQEDETQSKLLSGLSFICIFISLLGLLGLSAFSAKQRTKEIGVRKVHGATIAQIIYLLFKDVMFLVIIAAILVIPVVLIVMGEWLNNFAYQEEVNYFTFFAVGMLALIFTFITVAFHSLKTARKNPAIALKYE